MTPSAEIPFWIHDRPKWVSGITRQTTCQDILHALVKAERKANGSSLCTNGHNSTNKYSNRDRGGSVGRASATNSLSRGSSKLQDYEKRKDRSDDRREDITCRKISRQLALVEQWRGVERPLSGTSRILKLWNAWGEERNQVRFTIKRISTSSKSPMTTTGSPAIKPIQSTSDDDGTQSRPNGLGKRPAPPPPPQRTLASLITSIDRSGSTASSLARSRKPRRRNSRASASSKTGHSSLNINKKQCNGEKYLQSEEAGRKSIRYEEDNLKRSETVHPNALLKKRVATVGTGGMKGLSSNGTVLNGDIERLMRIILTQGETIHAQLKRLREREGQIENIEQQVHDSRTKTAGKDYLLNAYLNDSEQNHNVSSDDGEVEESKFKVNQVEVLNEFSTQRKQAPGIGGKETVDHCPRTSSPDGTSTHFRSLQDMLSSLNKVLHINDRIVSTEEHINDLQSQLAITGNDHKLDNDWKESREGVAETEEEASSTKSALLELKTLNDKFGKEIEANRQLIRSMKLAFDERRALVAKLEEDVSSVESEGHQLRAELASIQESRQRQTLEILSIHNTEINTDDDSEIGEDAYDSECDEEDIPILFAGAAFLKNENQHHDDIGNTGSPVLPPIVHHPPPTSMLLRNGHFQISNEQLYDQNHLPSHNPMRSNKNLAIKSGGQSLQQHDPRSLYDELQRRLQIKTSELHENCEELQTLQVPNKATVPSQHGNMMGIMMLDPNITNRITATGSPGSASSSGNSSGSGGSYGSQGDGKTVRFSDRDRLIATPELPDQLDDLLPPPLIAPKSQQHNLQTYRKFNHELAKGNSASNTTSSSDVAKGNSRKVFARTNGNPGSSRDLQTASLSNGGGNGNNSKPKSLDNVGDTDSNSDTGLSSLHSSSDEGTYVLDTLV